MKKKVRLLIILLTGFIPLFAQAPQAFKYQAIARGANGKIFTDKAISVLIEILDQSSRIVYSESHNVITNQFGLINLEIGKGTPIKNTFDSIDWSNGNHFISVSIDTNGGSNYSNIGSAQLLSVPYALYAEKSGGDIWQKNNSNIFYKDGKVGIGTTQPSSPLTLETNSDGNDRNLLYLYNKSQGSSSIAYIKISAGDTSSYTYLSQHSPTYIGDHGKYADFGSLYSKGAGLALVADTVIRFETNRDQINGGFLERMRIDRSGNVGIGTSQPTNLLTLQGTYDNGEKRNLLTLNNLSTANTAYTGITLKSGIGADSSFIQDFGSTYTASPNYNYAGFLNISNNLRGVMLQANSTNGILKFYTGHDNIAGGSIERMRIDSAGHVGIGTTNPQNALSIEGTEDSWPGRTFLSIQNNSTSAYSLAYETIASGNSGHHLVMGYISDSYTANSDYQDMADYGLLSSTGKGIIISAIKPDQSAGIIKFCTGMGPGTAFTERMRIDSVGHVGIGTTQPSSPLSIETNSEGNDRNLLYLYNKSQGSSSIAYLKISAGDTSSYTYLSQHSPTYIGDNGKYADFGQLYSNGAGLVIKADTIIKFETNRDLINGGGIERMRIDRSGHVGIGVTNPQRSLDIKDVMRLEPISSPPSSPSEGDIYMDATTHKLMVYDGTQWQACW